MTLAKRFAAAVRAAAGGAADANADGHLLPDRLAVAVAELLEVDGAGLSVRAGPNGHSPLGASSAEAALAERLQFTVGNGPCWQAHTSGQPVFVVERDIRHRWPAFADLLFTQTPFRGVVALPLGPPISGALDLLVTDPAAVARLDVFDAVAVGDLVTASLAEAAVWSTWTEATGPRWLHSPSAEGRAVVWQAVGRTGAELELPAGEVLSLLRAHAYGAGRSVDAVAADLVSGRIAPADVLGPAGGS